MRLEELLSALIGIPDLPGARCKGRSAIWESEDAELQEYALHQCLSSCPALAKCEEWLDSLKPSKRACGVVAGRVVRQHGKAAA